MKKTILFSLVVVYLSACIQKNQKPNFQNYETTIKVIDADKIPLIGRKIKLYIVLAPNHFRQPHNRNKF